MATGVNRRCMLVWGSVLLAIIIDQVIKIAVKTGMPLFGDIPVFGDWFHIHFVENNGMAFGMELFNKLFLTGFRLVAIGFLVYILTKLIKEN